MNWKGCFSAVLLTVVCLPLFLTSPGTCAGLQYEVVPVAQPSYENRYNAIAINENGWICGSRTRLKPSLMSHPFVWDGQQIQDIVYNERSLLIAKDINDSGQVVGEARLSDYRYRSAFLWENGVLRDIKKDISAEAINNLGQIIGLGAFYPLQMYQYTWDGEIELISTPWEGITPQLFDINDHGQILGRCVGRDGNYPFVWQNGSIVPLPLPVNTAVRTLAPVAINNNGVIAAVMVTGDSLESLFIYEPDGSIKTVREACNAKVIWRPGLNDHGDIVVTMNAYWGNFVSVIIKNGILTDLRSLLPPDSPWRITHVCDINNKRQIAASCFYGDSPLLTAALLQPIIIPEIDIMSKEENIIKANKQGLIKAAILSDEDFDATGIAPETLQVNGLKMTHCKVTDTNNDGRDDLLCQFRLSSLNLPLGQHTLTIQGTTSDNLPVRGQDSVLIVK